MKEIIDYVHALEAEIERLRWHYPDKEGFPIGDKVRTVLLDFGCGKMKIRQGNFLPGWEMPDVKRWRYIE